MKKMRLLDLPKDALEDIRFSHAEGILSTEINGESIIMNITSGQYSSFNPVGTCIWNALAGGNSFPLILELIVERFDVERDVAQNELAEFLETLLEKSLIIMSHSPEKE